MENFIVSARKYRPATFDTVVGQASITNTLKNAIRSNHLAQAICLPVLEALVKLPLHVFLPKQSTVSISIWKTILIILSLVMNANLVNPFPPIHLSIFMS